MASAVAPTAIESAVKAAVTIGSAAVRSFCISAGVTKLRHVDVAEAGPARSTRSRRHDIFDLDGRSDYDGRKHHDADQNRNKDFHAMTPEARVKYAMFITRARLSLGSRRNAADQRSRHCTDQRQSALHRQASGPDRRAKALHRRASGCVAPTASGRIAPTRERGIAPTGAKRGVLHRQAEQDICQAKRDVAPTSEAEQHNASGALHRHASRATQGERCVVRIVRSFVTFDGLPRYIRM